MLDFCPKCIVGYQINLANWLFCHYKEPVAKRMYKALSHHIRPLRKGRVCIHCGTRKSVS